MASHGPSYGFSKECEMKAQAKFDIERAQTALDWVEQITGQKLKFNSQRIGKLKQKSKKKKEI